MSDSQQHRIMFVCMGNICRSPTAHAVMQHKVNQLNLSDQFVIASSGTHAYHIGEGADQRSQQTARQRGIDMSELTAQKIAITDYDDYDWILAMDNDNLDLIRYYAPEKHHAQIRLFMEFAKNYPDVQEVPDPYYGGASGFDYVFDLVDDASQGLLDTLSAKNE